MGRIKVAAFAVRKKDCFTGNPCCQLALPRVSWFMTAACSRARGLWLENKGVLGFRSYETWVQNINSGCICTRKHLIKCIFKEIFCIKGIYLWFSHTNSSSYLMKVSVLILENQYQFRLIFLRDGLWGNVNLDYYTETVLWPPHPQLSGTKEHSYLLGQVFDTWPVRKILYVYV